MNIFLQNLLIWHVLLGLLGIVLFTVVLVALLRAKPNVITLKLSSILGLLSFLASWVLGGYYYVVHYGSAVKPIIKAGSYPWAHLVFMETKEHVFLFLPILAILVTLTIFLGGNQLLTNKKFKNSLALADLLIVLVGVSILFMGFLISSAA